MLKIIYFVGLSYLLIATNVVRCKPEYLFNAEAGGWLKLHRIPATWQEAFRRCHYEGAVLASPLNKQLAEALTSLVTGSGMKSAIFLGTHDLYSEGHFTSIEGVPVSQMELNWSHNEGAGDCLSMSTNEREYFVKMSSCTDKLPFVCYTKYTNQTMNECGTFDDDYQFKRCTGSCYKVHATELYSWARAFGICVSEGGHLVILNDLEEVRIVKEMFPVRAEQGPWDRFHVGLKSWTDDRMWTTIKGEKSEDVFNVGLAQNLEPSQDRASFIREGTLSAIDSIIFKAMFVCEKSPQSIQFEEPTETKNTVTPGTVLLVERPELE